MKEASQKPRSSQKKRRRVIGSDDEGDNDDQFELLSDKEDTNQNDDSEKEVRQIDQYSGSPFSTVKTSNAGPTFDQCTRMQKSLKNF